MIKTLKQYEATKNSHDKLIQAYSNIDHYENDMMVKSIQHALLSTAHDLQIEIEEFEKSNLDSKLV